MFIVHDHLLCCIIKEFLIQLIVVAPYLLRNSIRKYKTLGKQVAKLEIEVRFRFDTLEFLNKKSKKKDEMI